MILSMAFRSVQFHTQNDVPGYQDWLLDADLSPAYSYHRRFLQHLQSGGAQAGRRWLLKAPAHLFGLDALFDAYPDAVVVQTHRRPSEVVGSVSSLSASVRQAFSERLDLESIGNTSVSLWTRAMSDAMNLRAERPELAERFLDVRYVDFMAAPVDTIGRIMAHVGFDFDTAARERVRAYLAANPQARHGRHRYSLTEFGLDADAVDERFSRYIAQFSL